MTSLNREESMADELFAKIEARIRSGELVPGARLPTQQKIARTEKVSRTVVREAVARLTAQGLTVSRQGSGVFVSDSAPYRALQVTLQELNELSDVIKLLEIRLGVETEMAGLAAARRTTADVGDIQDALKRMLEQRSDAQATAKADREFHLAIAHATQNEYFVRFAEFLGLRLVPPWSLFVRDPPGPAHDAYHDMVYAEHRAIVEAIVRMDSARARDAARHHMQESLTRHSMLSAGARQRDRSS